VTEGFTVGAAVVELEDGKGEGPEDGETEGPEDGGAVGPEDGAEQH